ncbi:hypothetical protein [Planktothrix agardhii]|uniref:hypothetical protein n=1 Tax=Planktothrix agardhii TaxID=1160 RepID=UPI001F1C95B7|nr:hypothetical protein [Planktothrix agardhii]MCF3577875.1 hypothetical protein [Planktothrix agardhii 1812]MCF3583415.1 hypothetical protein [Planktothrix agardhii 1811]MCF3609618.1 hypothetical protein [Planktothrix agardhii 1033]MCF3627416.1 hypothetical protein [Planktothrix agardhii 1801]
MIINSYQLPPYQVTLNKCNLKSMSIENGQTIVDGDHSSSITAETLQLLAQRSGVQLKPEEIEPLCRVYVKLEQMKTLIRKPRNYSSPFAHQFQVHSDLQP